MVLKYLFLGAFVVALSDFVSAQHGWTNVQGLFSSNARFTQNFGTNNLLKNFGGPVSPRRVYTLSGAAENRVLLFDIQDDGSLVASGDVATGGSGAGEPSNTLNNQGAIITNPSCGYLLAVNTGSDNVSLFKITATGLELLNVAPSGGSGPVSVTMYQNLVYTLNSNNVVGFSIMNDELVPLPNATYPLTAAEVGPAQVEIRPDGKVLVVTERMTNNIVTWPVMAGGRLGQRVVTTSAVPTPFGMKFGPGYNLFVTEAAMGGETEGVVSSYGVANDGTLSLNEGSPITIGQTATCWIEFTKDQQLGFVSNTNSNTISSLTTGGGLYSLLPSLSNSGKVTIAQAVAARVGNLPIDVALSRDDKFFYVHNGEDGEIGDYVINRKNGMLQGIPGTTVVPLTANGLVSC